MKENLSLTSNEFWQDCVLSYCVFDSQGSKQHAWSQICTLLAVVLKVHVDDITELLHTLLTNKGPEWVSLLLYNNYIMFSQVQFSPNTSASLVMHCITVEAASSPLWLARLCNRSLMHNKSHRDIWWCWFWGACRCVYKMLEVISSEIPSNVKECSWFQVCHTASSQDTRRTLTLRLE